MVDKHALRLREFAHCINIAVAIVTLSCSRPSAYGRPYGLPDASEPVKLYRDSIASMVRASMCVSIGELH